MALQLDDEKRTGHPVCNIIGEVTRTKGGAACYPSDECSAEFKERIISNNMRSLHMTTDGILQRKRSRSSRLIS